MRKTIFISSTYEDLKPHRNAIWEVLEKYDVHINGMERFGARKETALQTCLGELGRSDIYLGIVAHRLGSIEPQTKKSFTQLEYELAADKGKEILIYLVDEAEGLITIKNVDFGERHEQLENFKKMLKEKHTIDTFLSPEDLAGKLRNRLDTLLQRAAIDDPKDNRDNQAALEKFHLFPKTWNNHEIQVKVRFNKNAFPTSKILCETFGFEFGETLGLPIEILHPKVSGNRLRHLFIRAKDSDFYFSSDSATEVDVLARLMFSDRRISSPQAQLFDEEHTVKKPNPNYDPTRPDYSFFTISPSSLDNPKYINETNLKEGEGTAILGLVRLC